MCAFILESRKLTSVVRRGCVGDELPMKTLDTESLMAVTDIKHSPHVCFGEFILG